MSEKLRQLADHEKNPTKPRPVSTNLLICEKALNEDGILSAIRIVDVFFFSPIPDLPADKQAIGVTIIVITKFPPDDTTEHSFELKLVRPDGKTVTMGESRNLKIASKFPGLPAGFNVVVEAAIKVEQYGTHHVVLWIDEKEEARIPFTLRPKETEVH